MSTTAWVVVIVTLLGLVGLGASWLLAGRADEFRGLHDHDDRGEAEQTIRKGARRDRRQPGA